MIGFVIYGVNIYVRSKYSYDFGRFLWKFSVILLIFCYPDPDHADQNETDPNGSGSATLFYSKADQN